MQASVPVLAVPVFAVPVLAVPETGSVASVVASVDAVVVDGRVGSGGPELALLEPGIVAIVVSAAVDVGIAVEVGTSPVAESVVAVPVAGPSVMAAVPGPQAATRLRPIVQTREMVMASPGRDGNTGHRSRR
jgi:hypothetical protein